MNTKDTNARRNRLRFIWVIPILLLIVTAIPKVIGLEFMVINMQKANMGHMTFYIGVIELICAIVFLIPKTRKLGFLLCVAYIGGIMSAQWIGKSFNMGLIMQILLWIGMYFEDSNLFRLSDSKF
ncbi:hypothetical protein [Aquimarina sp. MMG016]|uniref:hypothetical protein n=1 Tax=Aquimarina sp. MMG016 TaxID=2822690 RepID=UPI001B3A1818|nr:hypothetical protein [Aquimarina sp. MMG016]MBQ4820195.1 hypothetical protein [Aquimarina sp. MMG016]